MPHRSRTHRSRRHRPQWDLLTDDIWIHVIEHLDMYDKLELQYTCRRFYELLANPSTPSTWGRIALFLKNSDVWLVCEWVQRRLKGISAICWTHRRMDSQQRMVWQALVASTAGTSICLKLRSRAANASWVVLQQPSHAEMVQRLTALDISVQRADDITDVHSLAALRHLRVGAPADSILQQLDVSKIGGGAVKSQLHRLRTVQLRRVPPAAFFLPGTADILQQLHSLHLHQCPLLNHMLPSEMLRLRAVSRLELMQLPLRMMPDMRGLPALRVLIMSGRGGEPSLGASQISANHAELAAALKINPLGGAMGLTEVILHGIPVFSQTCAEAIERLPHLKLLAMDYLTCEDGAF